MHRLDLACSASTFTGEMSLLLYIEDLNHLSEQRDKYGCGRTISYVNTEPPMLSSTNMHALPPCLCYNNLFHTFKQHSLKKLTCCNSLCPYNIIHALSPSHSSASATSFPILLLPDTKPSLDPPSPDTILSNIIPRVLHILLAPLFRLPNPLQPVLFPLLNLLLLLQTLVLHNLCLVRNMHLVDVDEAARRLERMAEKLFARGYQIAVDGLGHEVHVPCCDCERDKNALGV